MALSKELEEELTCPIDLEFYEEPMILKCLHLLCEKDVIHMTDQDGLLQCPVCNKVSTEKDIKKDFRTKRMIELVSGNQDNDKGKVYCELCEQEEAVSKCRECNMFLGENCTRGHMKIPVTKLHKCDSLIHIAASNKEKILTHINQLNETFSYWYKTKKNLETEKSGKEKQNLDIEIEISSVENIIHEIKQTTTNLRQKLKLEIIEKIESADDTIDQVDAELDAIRKNKHLLEETVNGCDTKTLVSDDLVTELLSSVSGAESNNVLLPMPNPERENTEDPYNKVIEEFRNVKFSLESVSLKAEGIIQITEGMSIKSDVSVDSGDASVDPGKIVHPSTTKKTNEDTATCERESFRCLEESQALEDAFVCKSSFSLGDFFDTNPMATKVFDLKESPKKIAYIDGDIWVINGNMNHIKVLHKLPNGNISLSKTIAIHKKTGKKRNRKNKERNIPCEYKVKAVAQTATKSIIAACFGTKEGMHGQALGLVTINADGNIQDILDGRSRFWDVKTLENDVYGVDGEYLRIYRHQSNAWCTLKELKLPQGRVNMHISQNRITLYNINVTDIVIYNISTGQFKTMCFKRQGKPVSDCDFLLADEDGNLLVSVDCGAQLYLMKTNNAIQLLSLDGKLEYPFHSATDKHGQILVACYDGELVLLS